MQEPLIADSELLRQMVNGDEKALKSLHDRYWRRLYDFAVQKVEFQETAEEIVQDIFIDLWKRRESLSIEQLDSYLFRAAKNRVIDVIRAAIVRKHHEGHAQLNRNSENTSLDAEEQLAYDELQLAIHECINALPQKPAKSFG
jgi:RNA polymerase sigma factor (sigma-70 family)